MTDNKKEAAKRQAQAESIANHIAQLTCFHIKLEDARASLSGYSQQLLLELVIENLQGRV